MIVYKFGGASVKDAESVRNVREIIKEIDGDAIVVISAMGKITNALEKIHRARMNEIPFDSLFHDFTSFHMSIVKELFAQDDPIFQKLLLHFDLFKKVLSEEIGEKDSIEYDKIICFGELTSTLIVEAFCSEILDSCSFVDAREIIKTDSNFQYGNVNWASSQACFDQFQKKNTAKIWITQGFISSNKDGVPTSLGREGSDYSAGIFAFLSNAKSATIWKDVPGMLNADPRYFSNTTKLDVISYREAIELSYYGASVIHPKTIKPLENKNIPLYIRSFADPSKEGSVIQRSSEFDSLIPSYIFKENQTLVSISPKDFSFIEEDHLGSIFQSIFNSGIKLNLMQNTALSFSLVFDASEFKLMDLISRLEEDYIVKFNLGLKLLNIRHYNEDIIKKLTENYEVLIRQESRSNVRMVIKDID